MEKLILFFRDGSTLSCMRVGVEEVLRLLGALFREGCASIYTQMKELGFQCIVIRSVDVWMCGCVDVCICMRPKPSRVSV